MYPWINKKDIDLQLKLRGLTPTQQGPRHNRTDGAFDWFYGSAHVIGNLWDYRTFKIDGEPANLRDPG